MRFDRLDLTAFGPFTGTSLDLSAPGIHLVTGPNEAGKSTALHALNQLLYGIDLQSRYDFVHPKGALRLGARLQSASGSALEIIRTKSRNAPLQGPDGSPLDETDLTAVLGGIDRHTFTTVFALSSAELRSGGQTLVDGNGDLNQALAASRSGLSLTNTLRDIEARIAALYKKSGSKPLINVRIAALKDAQSRKKAASLRPESYLTQEKDAEAARDELEALISELNDRRSDRSRLERLGQALPALARRGELLAELEEIRAEGVIAPDEMAERLPALLEEARNTARLASETAKQLGMLDQKLAALTVDGNLLAYAETIEGLSQDRKAVQEAQRRLTNSAGDSSRLRAEAEELLSQVYAEADLEDTGRYRIPKSLRSSIQELHDRRTAIDTGLRQSRQALDTRRRKQEEAEQKLSELPPPEDSEPLRAVVTAIPQDLLTRMVAAEEAERKSHGRAEQILQGLRLDTLSVEDAGSIMVPTRAQTDAHIETANDLKRDQRDLAKRRKSLSGQLENKRLDLAALLKNDPPPTDEDLSAARYARDGLWCEIRDGQGSAADRASDFEQSVKHADQVSDQMRKEAERVNARFGLELEVTKDEHELTRLGAEQDELDHLTGELDAEWIRLWENYTGPAPKPAAASTTLDETRKLLETLSELGDAKSQLGVLRAQAAQHVARLRESLQDPDGAAIMVSLGAVGVLAELPELREIAENRLGQQAKAAQERSAREDRAVKEHGELSEAFALVSQQEGDLIRWEADWQQALTKTGLPAGRDTIGALTDLDRLDQVAAKMTEAVKTERDSELAATRVKEFHALLQTTTEACGRTLPEDDAERYLFVGKLHSDATANRSIADRRDLYRIEQEKLRTDADVFRMSGTQSEIELAELVARSGVDSADGLAPAVERRTRYAVLQAALAEVMGTIPIDAEPLRELVAKAQHTDPDQLAADLAARADEINDLETRRTEQSRLFAEKSTDLARLDGSAQAAQAAAEAEVAAAALVEETEEYLRLEIARNVLLACMEEYRNSQQDPVLTRAGQLFQKLTRSRFSGLELDQEGGTASVLAQRMTGELRRVDELSEATADQLYLALRLASLERYSEEDRALPFTVDDIFMTFDDKRTRATLAVLNEMADRFQMIVFTHHDHLAELARAELPRGRIHVHALPEFVPMARREPAQPEPSRACRSCGSSLTYSGRGRPPVQCADCIGG